MKALVLGSDADAHVAAALLARAGHEVTLIAERALPAQQAGWFPAAVAKEIGLDVRLDGSEPWLRIPLADGGALELSRDVGRTSQALRKLSERDAAKWPQFCRRMAALARLFEALYLAPPVLPTSLGMALKVRRLGREGMEDLMRVLPMSVAELLDDWFECDALKGALGAMGVMHLAQGVRSGGTAFRLLHHHLGSPEGVFRPPRVSLQALARPRQGVQVREARVERIVVREGQVAAAVLKGGEELEVRLIVSTLDPRRTLLELADPAWLDPELARALARTRRGGVCARLFFSAEAGPPTVLAPSLDYLEQAYDASKYAKVSPRPYLEAFPSGGKTEVHFQYAPYRLAEGNWDAARREAVGEQARRLLASHLPALAEVDLQVSSPLELESEWGWPQGQAHQVELSLDQALWMRPLPELADYRTPIEGLWLCGAGTHPGGGVLGASAYNCVRTLLKNSKGAS